MRLIDADWVLEHVKPYERSDEQWSVTGGTAIRLIHNAIDNAPTVDAVKVMQMSAYPRRRTNTHALNGRSMHTGSGAVPEIG